MLPARVIIVWLCNNTGRSVFIAVIFHTMMNLSEYMFPNYGIALRPVPHFRNFGSGCSNNHRVLGATKN
jgi:hypothetical protein